MKNKKESVYWRVRHRLIAAISENVKLKDSLSVSNNIRIPVSSIILEQIRNNMHNLEGI